MQGLVDVLGVLEHREDDDLEVGVALAQLGQGGEPVTLGHAQVEDDHVGPDAGDDGEHLLTAHRLADHLDVGSGLKRALDAVQHQPVVVGDGDAERGLGGGVVLGHGSGCDSHARSVGRLAAGL
jgi:hypothetical protein